MKKVLLLTFISFLFAGLNAQTTTVDLKALDQYYTQMVTDWEVPSVTIGIVKDGELIFTGAYGQKKVGTNEKPDANTLYAIASNSKAFTATLIGILVEEGKLGWDDKVQQYLPYFELYDPWVSAHVTIRDLLCHRVGLGTFSGDNIWYKSNLSAKDFIKHYKHVPQAYEFRAGYGYSNLMYIAAGEIIETVTDKSWGANIKERFLGPLGMDRTVYTLADVKANGNYATPHIYRSGKNKPIALTSWDNVAATGGLYSSVNDIAKWMVFNLNHGIHGQDTLITKATRNQLWKPHNTFTVNHTDADHSNHFRGYGLGWGLRDYHGRLMVSHTGGYDGMLTGVALVPDENLGVVVLTNGTKSPFGAAVQHAIDQFLGIDSGKDYSADFLKRYDGRRKSDTRIADRLKKRVQGTKPTIAPEQFLGSYQSDVYGKLSISYSNEQLKLDFAHSPLLAATLTHWHHDVWKINWLHDQAWFSFGTIKINTNANLEVTGFDFDVPNDDFFFEELKPYKVQD